MRCKGTKNIAYMQILCVIPPRIRSITGSWRVHNGLIVAHRKHICILSRSYSIYFSIGFIHAMSSIPCENILLSLLSLLSFLSKIKTAKTTIYAHCHFNSLQLTNLHNQLFFIRLWRFTSLPNPLSLTSTDFSLTSFTASVEVKI